MNQDKNSARFDISTVLPVGVGVISLFGICLLLIGSRLATPRAIVEVPDTATQFQYVFIGTEPGIASPFPSGEAISTRARGFSITAQSGFSGTDDPLDAENTQPIPASRLTGTPTDIDGDLFTSTSGPTTPTRVPTISRPGTTNTPITLPTVPASTATFSQPPVATSTSISAAPLIAGTYDDIDSHLSYRGDWISQTGQPGAEGGTLHVSFTLNNTLTFRFIGDQLRIIYQSGSSLGTLTAVIDGTSYPPLNQSGSPSRTSEWAITGLTVGTHSVTITHSSGGSVNIDQIIVPDVSPTATPTATVTVTTSP